MVGSVGDNPRTPITVPSTATRVLLASVVLVTSLCVEPSTRRTRSHQRADSRLILASTTTVALGPANTESGNALAEGAPRRSALARAMIAAVVQPLFLHQVTVAQIGGLYGP